MEEVMPERIAISANYHQDQTVYVVDDETRIWISETGGSQWTTVYETDDPGNPS